MIAVKQFFNIPESKSHFSELFELSFTLPNQPLKLFLEKKTFPSKWTKNRKNVIKSVKKGNLYYKTFRDETLFSEFRRFSAKFPISVLKKKHMTVSALT